MDGLDEVVLEKVEVTLNDEYTKPADAEDLKPIIKALAAKLGLDVDDDLKPTIAGAAVLAAAPRAARPVITKAEYNKDNGVLTLTIVKDPVSFEFTAATLADTSEEDPESDLYEEGSYKIDVVDNGNDHYTVKVSAKGLKEHQNGADHANRGHWVGVQIGSFSDNVKDYQTAYKGYASIADVDAAFENAEEDGEWITDKETEGTDFLAWYRDAEKDSENNKDRDWIVGIRLLDGEGTVLKTVYVTIDVSGVELYREPIPEPGTGDDAGNDEGPSQQTPSDEGSDTQE